MTVGASMVKSGKNLRAFNLLELVLVMGIIGVMAAIAAPRFANATTAYRADAAAKRVAADLALAQSNARITGSNQAVVFDTAANQVQLTGYADPDRPSLTYTIRLGDGPYQATLVSADFAGGNTLTFTAFGVPLAGGSVVVQVGSTQRTVFVNGVTGKASVQ
jgi:prepilin-type N-terminal cleavage/methylation domain-containing protein